MAKRKPRAQPTPEALAMQERSRERLRRMYPPRPRGEPWPEAHPDCERCKEVRRRNAQRRKR